MLGQLGQAVDVDHRNPLSAAGEDALLVPSCNGPAGGMQRRPGHFRYILTRNGEVDRYAAFRRATPVVGKMQQCLGNAATGLLGLTFPKTGLELQHASTEAIQRIRCDRRMTAEQPTGRRSTPTERGAVLYRQQRCWISLFVHQGDAAEELAGIDEMNENLSSGGVDLNRLQVSFQQDEEVAGLVALSERRASGRDAAQLRGGHGGAPRRGIQSGKQRNSC